jgi:hypothetical protein
MGGKKIQNKLEDANLIDDTPGFTPLHLQMPASNPGISALIGTTSS